MARITTFNEEDLTFDELQIVNMKRQIQDLIAENKYLKNELHCYKDSLPHDVSEMIDMKRKIQDLTDILAQGYRQDYKFNKEHAGIYRIYNKKTGESYVGQSHVDVYNRCMSHYIQAEWPESDWHYDLINNPDNYEYEILKEGVDNQGDLDKLEIYYIGYYHCLDEGYNKALAARYRFLGLHENEEI